MKNMIIIQNKHLIINQRNKIRLIITKILLTDNHKYFHKEKFQGICIEKFD